MRFMSRQIYKSLHANFFCNFDQCWFLRFAANATRKKLTLNASWIWITCFMFRNPLIFWYLHNCTESSIISSCCWLRFRFKLSSKIMRYSSWMVVLKEEKNQIITTRKVKMYSYAQVILNCIVSLVRDGYTIVIQSKMGVFKMLQSPSIFGWSDEYIMILTNQRCCLKSHGTHNSLLMQCVCVPDVKFEFKEYF